MKEVHIFQSKTNDWILDALYKMDCFLVKYYTKGVMTMISIPELKSIQVEINYE